MCNKCKLSAANTIAILMGAAHTADAFNSPVKDTLTKLVETLTKAEQIFADGDLAAIESLEKQIREADELLNQQPNQVSPAGRDDGNVYLHVHGARGVGKSSVCNWVEKLLIDAGFRAEVCLATEGHEVIKVIKPTQTLHSKGQAPGTVAPAKDLDEQQLTPSEVEVAKLLRSRLWKVLSDLPSGRGYRELTVEKLYERLGVEVDDANDRARKVEEVRKQQIAEQEKAQRIEKLVEALREEGVFVKLV